MTTPVPSPPPVWAPTRALGRAIVLSGLLILLGTLVGRVDLIVVAAPLILGTVLGLSRRPREPLSLAMFLDEDAGSEGAPTSARLIIANPDTEHFDAVVVRVARSAWLPASGDDRSAVTRLDAGHETEMVLPGIALRWGYHEIGPAVGYAVAGDGLLVSVRTVVPPLSLRVRPQMPPFRADPTMPRTSVLVGQHRSHRSGEGGELVGVRRYGPGDRLRRIDWRVTLRIREPYVAQTLSDRDAEVVVVLDVLVDAGRSGGVHGPASVLDTSVRAASAITEHYLRQGDRVGLLEYSGYPRHLRAAGGRQQSQLAVEWLLATRSTEAADDPPGYGIDPHLIPPSALVVVLSPILAPHTVAMIAELARAGRTVVTVDTLGQLARRAVHSSQWTELATSLWRLERENAIGALREVGVPVVGWVGPGSLDEVLRDMARMAAAPRLSHR